MQKVSGVKSLIWFSFFLALPVRSQEWVPGGPPNIVSYQFTTTGGITYFRLVGLLPGGSCCQGIAGYAVSREGTALSQTIQRVTWGGACILVYCEPWTQEVVSVLGALPPDNYTLTLWASGDAWNPWDPWDPLDPFSTPVPYATLAFTVPSDSSPTLGVTATTTDGHPMLQIHVRGVSKVVYVLESSANLTNWTALRTNWGAPVTFLDSISNGPGRFYRVSLKADAF